MGESRNRRRIRIASFALLGLLVVGVATAAGLLWYGDRQIDSVDVDTEMPGDTDADGEVDAPELSRLRNVLVVGSDSREDLTQEQRKELGTGSFEGTRTDTIMLLQLDPKDDRASMLSFPRDLLVERCDGSEGRINGAFEIGEANGTGGPTCTVQTVRELTGIPIHHYVQVDFEGFIDVVDTLGGVRMCLKNPIQDDDANVDLRAGCQTLSGQEALGFVRVRKIDNDLGRIERQQRFVGALADRVTSAQTAMNVPRLFRLADAVGGAVQTDDRLSLGVMRRIGTTFGGVGSNDIEARTVPAVDQTISGVAYLVPQQKAAEALFAAFRKGNPPPPEPKDG